MPPEHAARFEFRLLTLEESLQASQNPALDLPPDFIRAALTVVTSVSVPTKTKTWLLMLGEA